MKINLKQFLTIVLFSIVQILFSLSIIAPDYLGLLVEKPLANIIYYLPPFITSLYFALRFKPEKSKIKYFIKIIFLPLIVIAVSFILLIPLSIKIDNIRCQQSGFCVGGEPFDHMSTIFIFLFSFMSAARAVVSAIIMGVIIQLSKKAKKKRKRLNL